LEGIVGGCLRPTGFLTTINSSFLWEQSLLPSHQTPALYNILSHFFLFRLLYILGEAWRDSPRYKMAPNSTRRHICISSSCETHTYDKLLY